MAAVPAPKISFSSPLRAASTISCTLTARTSTEIPLLSASSIILLRVTPSRIRSLMGAVMSVSPTRKTRSLYPLPLDIRVFWHRSKPLAGSLFAWPIR